MNADELLAAIRAGDVGAVTASLVAATQKERRAAAKTIGKETQRWRWEHREKYARRRHAALVGWAGTATAREIASQSWSLTLVDDHLYDVLAGRGPSFMQNLSRMLLRDDRPGGWSIVRRAVREGLVPRPDQDGYLAGMVFALVAARWPRGRDAAYEGLLDDEALLDEVWRLFEQDLGGQLATWGSDDNPWIHALLRLAAEDRLDRGRLLDASLDALMRDFRESGVRWYAWMHEALEPTREERQERLDRYFALAAAPSPTALKESLAALKALGDAVPAEELARAAPTALTQPQKAHAMAMVRLLEAAARRDAPARAAVLATVAVALGHERADVQERALKVLERYPDDAPRAELLAYADVVSAPLRPRVAALTGLASAPEAIEAPALNELDGPAATLVRERRWPEPRVPDPRPGPPLAPVESVDELIELASMLLEGEGSGDDAERLLDGVSRLCDQRPPHFEQRTEGLVKQAQPPWNPFPEPLDGRQMVSMVVLGWVRGRKPAPFGKQAIDGLLAVRALEVGHRAARRVARPLLAFPTHEGGWLDPSVLAEREAASGRNGAEPADRSAAHFRARFGPGLMLVPRQVVQPERAWYARAQRIGVRVDFVPPELAYAQSYLADALRRLGWDRIGWYSPNQSWATGDALGARWQCTVLPAYPEVQFARALTAIGDCIDGPVQDQPEPVLEQMLDPHVPLRDPGWTVVAAALAAKASELRRAAADVVVATIGDGRFDPSRLGAGLAWLLVGGYGSVTRIEAPLRDAARVSALHAAQVLRALEILVAALPEGQRNLHTPLALAHELAADARTGVMEPATRAALERITDGASRSSKVARSARGLLGAERDDAAYDTILRLAAAALTPRMPARV